MLRRGQRFSVSRSPGGGDQLQNRYLLDSRRGPERRRERLVVPAVKLPHRGEQYQPDTLQCPRIAQERDRYELRVVEGAPKQQRQGRPTTGSPQMARTIGVEAERLSSSIGCRGAAIPALMMGEGRTPHIGQVAHFHAGLSEERSLVPTTLARQRDSIFPAVGL